MTPPATYPVIDGHVDLVFDLLRHHPDTSLDGLPKAWCGLPALARGGVRVIVSAIYCQDACNGPATAEDNLRALLGYWERHCGMLRVITSGKELEAQFRGSGAPGALLLLENADPLLEYDAEVLKRKGFRLVGLTHVGRNRIGCGNAVPDPDGLTPAGRALVSRLDRLGMAIDTAHLAEPSFLELADSFSGPLVSTHTGIRHFCDTPRNLTHRQIETILERGGVIGLAAYPGMLSETGTATIHDYFVQLDWLIQKYGPEGIGIGTDFGGFDGGCDGLEDHGRLPELAEMLSSTGYPDPVIGAVFGGNWLRVFSRLLDSGAN